MKVHRRTQVQLSFSGEWFCCLNGWQFFLPCRLGMYIKYSHKHTVWVRSFGAISEPLSVPKFQKISEADSAAAPK